MVFPVIMWQLDNKEGRAPKNWYFQAVVLEKTLTSSLDCEEIKTVNLKGNQPWILSGRTDAEVLKLWPLDVRSQLIGKDSDAGKIDGRRRRGWQRMRWWDGSTDSMDMNLGKLWEMVKDGDAWHTAVHGPVKCQTQLGDWTTTKNEGIIYCINH